MAKGYVYLLRVEGTDIYKIGFSASNPSKRVKSLQTGNAYPIVLVDYFESDYARKIEKTLHRSYSHFKYIESDFFRLKGEWFALEFSTFYFFKDTCDRIEKNLVDIKRIKANII